jgi:tetratricopeptide (TPR) repeat protein
MWDGRSVPDPHVLELKRQEFIYERADADEPVYVFRHALTHDVAYESLLESRRQILHAAAGRALERLYAGRLDEAVDRLAYHYSKAGDASRGVEYLLRSADKAARVYANADAVKALQEALRLVERLPTETRDRSIITILLRLAHSLYFLGRNADSLDLLQRHRERVEQVGDPHLSGAYYFWLGHTYSYLWDQEQARQQAQRAIEEAARCNDPTIAGKAYYVLARTGIWSGRSRQGVEDGLQAVSLLEKTPERWWLGQSHWVVAGNFYLVGEFEAALVALDACDAIGEAIGDPRLRTYAAWTAGLIHTASGEWEKAIQACQLALDRSPDPINTAAALGFGGGAYVEKGDAGEAIRWLTQAVEHMTTFRFRQLLAWFQALLTDAYRLHGQLDEARALAMQAVEVSTGANFQFGAGLARRALGRVAQAEGRLAESEAHLVAALVDFTDTYARFEVGRTHLDLGVLASAQGRQEAAATHLADAHALFVTLRVPRFVTRTAELARQLGVVLPEEA